jgi:lysophospholipase L1-like esterase
VHNATRLLMVALVLFGLLGIPGSGVYVPYTIAALGDSITQATNTCCEPGNQPGKSWSTGDDGFDGVRSHYERLADLHPRTGNNHHNNSVSGAIAADLPAQVSKTVAQKADYVTILIGANDLCTPSTSTMTSTADFAEQIDAALDTLQQGLPRARIFVASIPDLHRLWSVLRTNSDAARAWAGGRICQSMLSATNTEAQRQEVVSRQIAFNRILAETCGNYENCQWDGGTVYRYKFPARHISTMDYFHPSPAGQASLAELTWNEFRQHRPRP